MRFYEKLPKLRKSNNFSQEQLADKLGVSRQAVSKWEIGNSYPDMEKMLQMCKILNCNLEDLMDDGVIGENNVKHKSNKFSINIYMNDFLSFITRSYNMFCNMKFKEKIKFLFEMACICIVLVVIGLILNEIIYSVIANIVGYSLIASTITKVLRTIFEVIFGVIGIIIVLHLYKIRYLDYFITIEDQNVTEQTIEEPIEKKEDKYYQEKPRERIIIRDAKHSAASFFHGLWQVLLVMIKMFVILCALPVVASFAVLITFSVFSLYYIQYGILFLWIALVFLGIGLLTYAMIEWAYNFVINKKQHFKRIFIILITGLILSGASVGLSVGTYLNYENRIGFNEEDYKIEFMTISVRDNTVFDYNEYNYSYIIDNSINDIQLEVKSVGFEKLTLANWKENEFEKYIIYHESSLLELYDLVLKDLKNKIIREYDSPQYIVEITMSQNTKDLLDKNSVELEESQLQEETDNALGEIMLEEERLDFD